MERAIVDAVIGVLKLAAGETSEQDFIDWVRSHTQLPS
jgi:hypothetical protein